MVIKTVILMLLVLSSGGRRRGVSVEMKPQSKCRLPVFPQYISMLELLGSVDMMTRNLPYRKYRPVVNVLNNTRIWSENRLVFFSLVSLMFAATCVRHHDPLHTHPPHLHAPQVEVRDHEHPGGGRQASAPDVVVAAHPPPPAGGQALPGAVQDQDHQQEAERGAAQGAGGEIRGCDSDSAVCQSDIMLL